MVRKLSIKILFTQNTQNFNLLMNNSGIENIIHDKIPSQSNKASINVFLFV